MEDKKKKDKKNGVSLVYVLIILSIISVFSVSFIHFVKEKSDIISLKSKGNGKNAVSMNYLINKEKKNTERILTKGIIINGTHIFPEHMEQYFNSKIEIKSTGDVEIKRLIFLPEMTVSIGGFHIEKVTDGSGNKYNLPLNPNTVYDELEIIYVKTVLNRKIIFVEKILFKRADVTLVDIILKESGFVK